jgi:5,10-methylenetetrahydrofolate reductase
MRSIREAIQKKLFVVTAELAPVKGVDLSEVLAEAERIKGKVHGLNITDNQRAIMRSSPIALSRLLLERGINPICQITCRDRNRLALQSDLLAMSILGVKEILLLTGDSIGSGDHTDAKPVFDMDSLGLIQTARILMAGKDLSGKELKGSPEFFIGAAVNPGAEPMELQVMQSVRKIAAGVSFFQTQLMYDVSIMERFINALAAEGIKKENIHILAGIFPLKSAKQAKFFNEKISGVKIPELVIQRLEESSEPAVEGLRIAWELIEQFSRRISGVHIMTMGNTQALEYLLNKISTNITNKK